MKFKLLLTAALLLGLSTPVFAQDAPSTTTPSAIADAGAAPDAMPPAAAPVEAAPVETPEAGNGDAVEKPSNASEKPGALSNLSDALMDILIPAISTLFLGLVAALIAWVRKKFKLDEGNAVSLAMNQWSDIATKAAARGGEWARNKAKDLTEDKKVPGPEVLEVAVDWAVEAGKAYGLPEMGREKLVGLIEAKLHMERQDPEHPREA